MTLTLIRHGATPGNAEKRYIGTTDEELSETGRNELLKLQSEIRYPQAELLFSSPLKRCLQTAELLYGKQNPVVIDDFREMNFGRFEGMNYRDLNGNPQYQAWIDSGGTLAFPDGEDREAFTRRCVRGLKVLNDTAAGRSAVAVVHGGTIMAVLSVCAGGDYWSYQTENGLGWTMELIENNGSLQCLNVEKIER